LSSYVIPLNLAALMTVTVACCDNILGCDNEGSRFAPCFVIFLPKWCQWTFIPNSSVELLNSIPTDSNLIPRNFLTDVKWTFHDWTTVTPLMLINQCGLILGRSQKLEQRGKRPVWFKFINIIGIIVVNITRGIKQQNQGHSQNVTTIAQKCNSITHF